MDQLAVVQTEAGVTNNEGKAYSTAAKTLNISPDGALEQVKLAQGLTPSSTLVRSQSMQLPTKPAAQTTTTTAAPPPAPLSSGERRCFKCGQTGHLAANCPIKTDWTARKAVVSKAVGLMMDAFEREDV